MNKLIVDVTEYTEIKDILNCQTQFYSNLYTENNDLTDENIETYIGENEKKLSDIEAWNLEGELEFGELAYVLKNMKNAFFGRI